MLSNEELVSAIVREGGVLQALESGVKSTNVADNQIAGAIGSVERLNDDLEFFVKILHDALYRKGYPIV